MKTMSAMVDMRRTPAEKKEAADDMPAPASVYAGPEYPYGLCISLDNDTIDKLGLDMDVGVGEMVHLMAMAKVTSVSSRDTGDGPDRRIELQITHIAAEDEDDEDDEESAKPTPAAKRRSKLYKDG